MIWILGCHMPEDFVPSLRELYFSFFDANHQVIGNPDLKAETSHSFTGSLSLKKKKSNGLIYTVQSGGFYNDVKNLIDYVFTQGSDTAKLYNVYSSKTSGISINTSVTFSKWNFSAGAAYTGFNNEQYEADKSLPGQVWSAEANANAGYSFTKIGLDLNLFYKLIGKRPRYVLSGPDVVLSEQDGYHLADFTLTKKLFHYLTLNAGIRNIFDADRINSSFTTGGVHTSGGLNVATGRSYFASILFNWNKK